MTINKKGKKRRVTTGTKRKENSEELLTVKKRKEVRTTVTGRKGKEVIVSIRAIENG